MFPNTPYLRKCIAMDKLFTVWRKTKQLKKRKGKKKKNKKKPESYPFEKMCVDIYIYI